LVSNGSNEFPLQVITNLFPDGVVGDQSVTTLEKWEKDLVLVKLEEFEELVEDVGIGEKVGSVVGTIQQKRRLNILKHGANLLLNLRRNGRRRIAVESGKDVGPMLIIF
jgi:hypothetical protein